MPPARKADVVVAVDRATPSIVGCLRQVVEIGDPALNRLIVVTGPSADPALEQLAREDLNVLLVRQPDHSLEIEAWDRGLLERAGDAVLIAADTVVTAGWLSELSEATYAEERVAFAWPLSGQGDGGASAPAPSRADAPGRAFAGLPRFTTTSTIQGACIYMRGQALDAVGLLEPAFSTLEFAIEEWVMRTGSVGYYGKRANHAYVEHGLPKSAGADGALVVHDQARLEALHPHREHRVTGFRESLDGRLVKHAIEFVRSAKIRVAYDLRGILAAHAGVRRYAIDLAHALGELPEIELSLLVDDPAQADGFTGTYFTGDDWREDFAVIHKLAPFRRRQDLAIPYGSSAHVIVSYQALSAVPSDATSGSDDESDALFTTGALGLVCAQGIVADSEGSRERIVCELGIPSTEITVVSGEDPGAAVFRVYRSAVLNPTERSLQARRMLQEAILSWSDDPSGRPRRLAHADAAPGGDTMGVRHAWGALHVALQRRVGREMRRLRVSSTRNRTSM